MSIINSNIKEIEKLCLENNVKFLYAFGSVLSDSFTNSSDIDLLVDFDSMAISEYADNYYNLKFGLQKLFNREVDLLEQKALKNPYFLEHINQQKCLVYAH
jgi:predicted nucleotidyltransferase